MGVNHQYQMLDQESSPSDAVKKLHIQLENHPAATVVFCCDSFKEMPIQELASNIHASDLVTLPLHFTLHGKKFMQHYPSF